MYSEFRSELQTNSYNISYSFPLYFSSFTAAAFTTTLTGGTRAGLKNPRITVSRSVAVSPASVTAPALSLDLRISTKRYEQDAETTEQSQSYGLHLCFNFAQTEEQFNMFLCLFLVFF